MEPVEYRPDGTPVYGPPRAEPTARVLPGLALAMWVATCGLAFALGWFTSPQADAREVIADSIMDGCIPRVGAVHIGTQAEAAGASAVDVQSLEDSAARDITATTRPIPPGPIADAFPDQGYISWVFYRSCVGGAGE